MTLRNLARIGATGALAIGALGLAATPALAADVDFGVDLAGTTIAADASGKFASLTLTNKGTTKPAKVNILFDFTGLKTAKVAIANLNTCKVEDGTAFCEVDAKLVPAAGTSADLPVPLTKVAGASGAAGKLTVTVQVEGDTNKANDTKTVDVTVGDSDDSRANGADLRVDGQDVTTADGNGLPTGKPVAPGGVGSLLFAAVNYGDKTASGVTVRVTLPPQTTFAENFNGCTQTADKRTFTCDVPEAVLIPKDKAGKDAGQATYVDFLPVRVSPDAKGPVTIKGGTVTITALKETVFSPDDFKPAPAESEPFGRLTAADIAELEPDLRDSTDDFAVLVAAPAAGQGGSDPANGDDDNGPLPVTGPAGYAIGGTGLAVIALGVGLFVAARRRRIVLVTPGDEK